jgi:hypothetical protein
MRTSHYRIANGGAINVAVKAAQQEFPTILIPRQTLESRYKVLQKQMAEVDEGNDSLDKFDRNHIDMDGRMKGSLTSASDRAFLQSLVVLKKI